jgi:hypothetical protein
MTLEYNWYPSTLPPPPALMYQYHIPDIFTVNVLKLPSLFQLSSYVCTKKAFYSVKKEACCKCCTHNVLWHERYHVYYYVPPRVYSKGLGHLSEGSN